MKTALSVMITFGLLLCGVAFGQTVTAQTVWKHNGTNGLVGWANWGANNMITYSQWRRGHYELRIANQSGGNDLCVTCTMSQFTKQSAGAGAISPDGKWIVFMGQIPGAPVNQKPGSGGGYVTWITDWPVVHGPWRVGVAAPSLWPQWATDGTHFAYTAMYQPPSTPYPLGIWKVYTQSFNPASPGAVTGVTPCEVTANKGMHELGDWFDGTYLAVMAQSSTTGSGRYEYIGFKMKTTDCSTTTITDPTADTWVEFIRVSAHWSPVLIYAASLAGASNPFCVAGSDIPCTSIYKQATPGTAVARTKIFDCANPAMPLYLPPPVFCAVHGVSPDGLHAIVEQMGTNQIRLLMLTLAP